MVSVTMRLSNVCECEHACVFGLLAEVGPAVHFMAASRQKASVTQETDSCSALDAAGWFLSQISNIHSACCKAAALLKQTHQPGQMAKNVFRNKLFDRVHRHK